MKHAFTSLTLFSPFLYLHSIPLYHYVTLVSMQYNYERVFICIELMVNKERELDSINNSPDMSVLSYS